MVPTNAAQGKSETIMLTCCTAPVHFSCRELGRVNASSSTSKRLWYCEPLAWNWIVNTSAYKVVQSGHGGDPEYVKLSSCTRARVWLARLRACSLHRAHHCSQPRGRIGKLNKCYQWLRIRSRYLLVTEYYSIICAVQITKPKLFT